MVQNFEKENHIKAVKPLDAVGKAFERRKKLMICKFARNKFPFGKKLCNMSTMPPFSMWQSENERGPVLLQGPAYPLVYSDAKNEQQKWVIPPCYDSLRAEKKRLPKV